MTKQNTILLTVFLIVIVLQVVFGLPVVWQGANPQPIDIQQMGATNLDYLVLGMPTDVGTATPGLMIENAGGLSNPVEVRKNATPVFYVDADGNVTYTGMSSAGGLISEAAGIAAPTAVGTATPAFYVDSLGVSNLFEVRDAATPVFAINNGGGIATNGAWASGQTVNNWARVVGPTAAATATPAMVVDNLGAGNVLFDVRKAATPVLSVNNDGSIVATGAGTWSSGQTVNNWVKAAAPTAIATATPAMVVDSLGVSNILEVRDAATPVFSVENGGNVTGKVLRYATAGSQIICGTTTVTGTATQASGLTTASYCLCSLNADFAADTGFCTSQASSGNCLLKTWKINATPTAADVGVSVAWCAVGTP